MAYNEKYFLTYCTPLGVPCRISIKHIDFVGTAIELIGQDAPITFSYDNGEDFKFEPIIESEASVNLIFDDAILSFEELWTSNERTFRVDHIIDGNLDWTGFVVPEGFYYNLKGGYYPVVLKARDGLATLEGILFKTDSNQFYGVQDLAYNNGAEFPFVLILTEILRKLDLGIDLWTLVDYYEQTMTTLNEDNRNSDPLSLAFANVKTYVNDTDRKDIAYFEDVNEAWDCKKIIENICNIWGARLYQENGVWKFKSIHADSVLGFSLPDYIEDSFVGTNPAKILNYWKYECYYSENSRTDLTETNYFHSKYETASLNDIVFADTGVTLAEAGYYLIKGTDKLVQINSDGFIIAITGYYPAADLLYWKKYNNTAGYLGRELAYNNTEIPCDSKDVHLLNNDALVRMDKVYKQFRVNYEYTFIREGDSPVNLIKNGNFRLPYEQYGGIEAPPNWERWKLGDLNVFFGNQTKKYPYPKLRQYELTGQDIIDTNGETFALEYGRQYNDINTKNTTTLNSRNWGLIQTGIDFTTKVDSLSFTVRCRFPYQNGGKIRPVFRLILKQNLNSNEAYALENVVSDDYDFAFTRYEVKPGEEDILMKFFYLDPILHNAPEYVSSEASVYKWYTFNVKVSVPSILGNARFFLHGYSTDKPTKVALKNDRFPVKFVVGDKTQERLLNAYDIPLNGYHFTGIELSYIPDPNEEIPKSDYIYANGDINYTFQDDPIKVYNGDTTSPEIISSIIVPTNESGINRWDTFNNDFGKSDIGMVLCKSVMQQYYKPNRLIDCSFKSETFRYGGILNFEAIPGINFIMLRGTHNAKRGYWEDCTLAEISNNQIAAGGITNNDSLDPKWVPTGNTRCIKDEDGLNTGEAEEETQDVNTNSESFGDYRWTSTGESDSCPIGTPSKYYWGTDIEAYNTDNFKDYTVLLEDESIGMVQVSYDNTGDKYIYFLHLASLGSVTQISNDYQNQIISSYTYLADVTINGYLYRVLRQNFVTGVFTDFNLIYYIQ